MCIVFATIKCCRCVARSFSSPLSGKIPVMGIAEAEGHPLNLLDTQKCVENSSEKYQITATQGRYTDEEQERLQRWE